MPNGTLDTVESTWRTSLHEFGEYLADRRRHILRLSQAEMAARVGLDQSSISRIENGHRPRDKAAAVALAAAYRLSAAETRAWLELLFGDALIAHPDGTLATPSWGEWIGSIYTLLESAVGKNTPPRLQLLCSRFFR